MTPEWDAALDALAEAVVAMQNGDYFTRQRAEMLYRLADAVEERAADGGDETDLASAIYGIAAIVDKWAET